MPMIKVKSNTPVLNLLNLHQRIRARKEGSCDTHLICEDGYIPCHKFVLMANSCVLNELILDNLDEIGHMDANTIISLSFPEVKTCHMAAVVSMFYTGKAVCQMKDVFGVMGIMKILGNEVSSTCPATEEDISAYCKPRYFIETESDSEEEDTSRVTSNVFAARKQRQLDASSTVQDANLKAAKNISKSKRKSNAAKEKPEKNAKKDDVPDVPIEENTSFGNLKKSQNRNQPPMVPKSTRINIKDLMQRKTQKRVSTNNKERNSKREKQTAAQGRKSMESYEKTVSTSATHSKQSITSKQKTSNKKSGEKRKIIEESDCEFDSDDSALEIIRVRKPRKLTPKSPEKRKGLRTTPLRASRKISDGNVKATIKESVGQNQKRRKYRITARARFAVPKTLYYNSKDRDEYSTSKI